MCKLAEYRQDVMQKSDLAFSMAVRPCDFDEDELDTPPPDWDAVRYESAVVVSDFSLLTFSCCVVLVAAAAAAGAVRSGGTLCYVIVVAVVAVALIVIAVPAAAAAASAAVPLAIDSGSDVHREHRCRFCTLLLLSQV